MVLVTSTVGTALPAARYTSYEVAPADAGQLSLADVCEGNTIPFAGDVLVTQAGTDAVVKVVVLVPQPVAAPNAFLGAMYQLYKVPAINPLAL